MRPTHRRREAIGKQREPTSYSKNPDKEHGGAATSMKTSGINENPSRGRRWKITRQLKLAQRSQSEMPTMTALACHKMRWQRGLCSKIEQIPTTSTRILDDKIETPSMTTRAVWADRRQCCGEPDQNPTPRPQRGSADEVENDKWVGVYDDDRESTTGWD